MNSTMFFSVGAVFLTFWSCFYFIWCGWSSIHFKPSELCFFRYVPCWFHFASLSFLCSCHLTFIPIVIEMSIMSSFILFSLQECLLTRNRDFVASREVISQLWTIETHLHNHVGRELVASQKYHGFFHRGISELRFFPVENRLWCEAWNLWFPSSWGWTDLSFSRWSQQVWFSRNLFMRPKACQRKVLEDIFMRT